MNSQFKYLVYDIETVINKPLLNKVCYANENLTDEEAYEKHVLELAQENREFINPSFHKPIAIGAVALADDFSIKKIGMLGGKEKRTTATIVKDFWDIYNKKQPNLIDFGGKGFDVRVLELWAFHLGITIHNRHFVRNGARYRFSDEQHCDLYEFLTNYGAVKFRGGLDLFSKLLGKPGKLDTKGNMVQALYEKGEQFRIDDYCLCDVMDTYFVYLRTRVMVGDINLETEQKLVDQAHKLLEEKNKEEGYFVGYLENFGSWKPEE